MFSNYSVGADVITTTPREKLENIFIKYGADPLPAFTNPDWNILNGNIFQIHGSYIIIDGLYFHDNTNPPGSDRKNKNVQKLGAVYLALGTHHNIVRNCEFYNSPVGIKIKGKPISLPAIIFMMLMIAWRIPGGQSLLWWLRPTMK